MHGKATETAIAAMGFLAERFDDEGTKVSDLMESASYPKPKGGTKPFLMPSLPFRNCRAPRSRPVRGW